MKFQTIRYSPTCLHVHLCICFHRCASFILLSVSILTSKYHAFLSCFVGSAQRGVILSLSPGQTRCDLETFKLENSKVPLCPPLPNLPVVLQPQPGTGRVPLGLKRSLKPQARQAHLLKLKLTRGALTTLIVGLVSSTSWDRSRFACRCSCLPACMENVLVSLFEAKEDSL